MATLEDQLETAKLSTHCKVDLTNHIEQVHLQSSKLPKRPVTMFDANLPSAVDATTTAHELSKSLHPSIRAEAKQRYLRNKAAQAETLTSLANIATQNSSTHFKDYEVSYHDQPSESDPFRESRRRDELSTMDEDFVHRYTVKMTRSQMERPVREDVPSLAARDAYVKAFRSYKGRDPTEKDLEEVDRLHFGFDELGEIGVVQKPHSCFPHSHITCCNRRPVKCRNQVYEHEIPAVRGARDRFPGPVPIWSSTKNLHAMVGSDMHHPGHQNTTSVKRATTRTMLASNH